MVEKKVYVVGREPAVEARHLLEIEQEAAVLLLGRAVMLPATLFGRREVFAMAEEIRELGLEGKVSPTVKALSAREIVDLLLERKVLNFG